MPALSWWYWLFVIYWQTYLGQYGCTPTKQGTIHTGLDNWSWHRIENKSPVDFLSFAFVHTLICFPSPQGTFWLISKHFPTSKSTSLGACHILNYWNKKLYKVNFSKSHFPRKRGFHMQLVKCQKIGGILFQIKTESVLLQWYQKPI